VVVSDLAIKDFVYRNKARTAKRQFLIDYLSNTGEQCEFSKDIDPNESFYKPNERFPLQRKKEKEEVVEVKRKPNVLSRYLHQKKLTAEEKVEAFSTFEPLKT
jgi:hypothetical protein